MTVTELLLNSKDTPLSSVVCQTAIQTAADKLYYLEKGYAVELTEAEFRKKFPELNPAHIVYTPAIGCTNLYFNPDTLAVCVFHLPLLMMPSGEKFLESTLRGIELCERDTAAGIFTSAILCLPDRMRLDYFTLLVQKFGTNVNDLYKQFMDAYQSSDYGFRGMDQEVLTAILQSKTEADRKRTAVAIAELPNEVIIYRGFNTLSADYEKAMCNTAPKEAYSWTLDVNVANFFAARLGRGPAFILTGKVKKKNIIEAFLGKDGNGEEEIIVNPKDVTVIERYYLPGLDYLGVALPRVTPIYLEYKQKLQSLQFTRESEDHGVLHSLRVLLLTQLIAEEMGLPRKDRKMLAMAAIYHDTRRTHDGDDTEHGKAAGQYYWENEEERSPVVKFLCEYHCLPDEQGLRKAQLMTMGSHACYGKADIKRLLSIFKDADALDRVRFGIRALDWNQLRYDTSRSLPLVARINVENTKN